MIDYENVQPARYGQNLSKSIPRSFSSLGPNSWGASMQSHVWTEADFDKMSWHDNHVHGIRFIEGKDGEGDLILDVDHILEWLKDEGSGFRFRILPVILTFHGVIFPRISVDYAAATAAFGPFMIHGIERRMEKRAHYEAQMWRLPIAWPGGEIEFEARGFTQRGEGEPLLVSAQLLKPEQRNRAP